MSSCFITQPASQMIPLKPVVKASFEAWVAQQPAYLQTWLQVNRFTAEPGSVCMVPDQDGHLEMVLVGLANPDDFWIFGDLPARLSGQYYLDLVAPIWSHSSQWQRAIIAWGLGSYSFNRYQQRRTKPDKPQLLIPEAASPKLCQDMVASIALVRDLINTPAEDMGPEALSDAAVQLAKQYGSDVKVLIGEELLSANYPAIYAVGKGSTRPPRLVDFQWGPSSAPLVTLVGKGICFDSGGLNLKSSEGMRTMKKDMGGAAHVLGLAQLIMSQRLPVRLRVLIPIAENMVAGNSYRPGDVVATRAGISVEIANTDAEGRLVLCDALTAAAADSPDLLLDFATLTGAARVAVGPDITALFTNQDNLAQGLIRAAEQSLDPIWRLPLHQPYERYLKSEVADICNAAVGPYAGAITAALYLKQFIPDQIAWAHFDISAWNFDKLPGRPVGGEANALRAVYTYLQDRYSKS